MGNRIEKKRVEISLRWNKIIKQEKMVQKKFFFLRPYNWVGLNMVTLLSAVERMRDFS